MMNLCTRLREMEKHYENVKEQIKQYQPEASAPLAYENDNIFKEIYSIKSWKRLCEFFQSQRKVIEKQDSI